MVAPISFNFRPQTEAEVLSSPTTVLAIGTGDNLSSATPILCHSLSDVETAYGTDGTLYAQAAYWYSIGSFEFIGLQYDSSTPNGGSGYADAADAGITVTADVGDNIVTPAVLTPVVSEGRVTSVTVTNGGEGYEHVPTLVFSDPTNAGTTATAVARVRDGAVVDVHLTGPETDAINEAIAQIREVPGKVDVQEVDFGSMGRLTENPNNTGVANLYASAFKANCARIDAMPALAGDHHAADQTVRSNYIANNGAPVGDVHTTLVAFQDNVPGDTPVDPATWIVGQYIAHDALRGKFRTIHNKVATHTASVSPRVGFSYTENSEAEIAREQGYHVAVQDRGTWRIWGGVNVPSTEDNGTEHVDYVRAIYDAKQDLTRLAAGEIGEDLNILSYITKANNHLTTRRQAGHFSSAVASAEALTGPDAQSGTLRIDLATRRTPYTERVVHSWTV